MNLNYDFHPSVKFLEHSGVPKEVVLELKKSIKKQDIPIINQEDEINVAKCIENYWAQGPKGDSVFKVHLF